MARPVEVTVTGAVLATRVPPPQCPSQATQLGLSG